MIVLFDVSPITTQDLWNSAGVTIRFLVTSLTKALLPRLLLEDSSCHDPCFSVCICCIISSIIFHCLYHCVYISVYIFIV